MSWLKKKPITNPRIVECPDGIVAEVDPGTVEKKKHRHRHVKDGAPKCMRGIPHEKRAVYIDDYILAKEDE